MFDGLMTQPNSGTSTIQRSLESVRRHLGMEVAYVSKFVDGMSLYREVDAPGLEALIKPGDTRSLDDVYCRHILAGRLPELIPDTSRESIAASMPITAAVPIGSHMSVPIRLPDGAPYGMFCCLSPRANPTLNARDLAVMRVFADLAAHEIAREVAEEETRATRLAEVREVIRDGMFAFRFQPILAIQPFQVVGFEALTRFTAEPYRSPDIWFNDAHAVGLGVELESAVLRQAARAVIRLPYPTFVSVNASPRTILDGKLLSVFAGLPLDRLVLEVTEHDQVDDYAALRVALAPLRKEGVRLAIDDAGAGYSSLRHILQLRPDIIKLDMALTRDVDRDPAKRALTAALCHFARETGCQIVAEGIETESEFATLEALGVAKGQGYLLGKPGDLATANGLVGLPAELRG
jgi:EAL domain-containing protein (putative c-di-GMP-specific phosphodiesterase class I)